MKTRPRSVVAILHNIRSKHNVGSMFRTADGVGVKHLYLTGYTPAPQDRFDRPVKEIAKTALGAEHSVPWTRVASLKKLLQQLKKEQYSIVALEIHPRAKSYRAPVRNAQVACLVGNETRGISEQLLRKVDQIIAIPMRGKKESLNVGVAFGIALYALTDYH